MMPMSLDLHGSLENEHTVELCLIPTQKWQCTYVCKECILTRYGQQKGRKALATCPLLFLSL